MRAEILAVGDELLSGRILDTNTRLIIGKLMLAGVAVRRTQVCSDDESELVQAMNQAVMTCDLLVVCGGLGPTQDDRTAAVAAKVFESPLRLDEPTLTWLQERFGLFNIPFTENNKKQCYFPDGAQILDNPMGTARGFAVRFSDNGIAFFLPGPPRELEPMLDNYVVPIARRHFGLTAKVLPLVFKTFGLTESRLDQELSEKPLTEPGCTVGLRAKFPEIHVHVAVEADDEAEAKRRAGAAREWVHERVGPLIFSETAEVGLEDVVAGLLKKAQKTFAVAESCTGGTIGEMITNVPGASAVFDRGFVTYSNQAKIDLLGVKPETIDEYGAVSEECAIEMAKGARERSGVDVAVSVTGIAGPDGGNDEKPVGTVYIALADESGARCRRFAFRGSRQWVRTLSAFGALDLTRRTLSGEDPWSSSAYLSRWQSRKR